VYTIGLDRALELLSQPKATRQRAGAKVLREMGPHPTDGEPVNVYEGRYGPYVKHGATNASLPKGVSPDELGMDQALSLLAAKAVSGKAKPAKRKAPRGAAKKGKR
jgi:DNA topoisomerase-1